ncbi:serine hydrolase [Arthrobacter sp. UYCu712]|uniref:serine hydrolase n=1 Tax=Arthrobacter sp. UYCu712 TaxID=3156340 RepID=UPI0033935195
METNDPRQNNPSGRHGQGADKDAPGRLRRLRPRLLTAGAAALALISATAVYASVQSDKAEPAARPDSSISATPTMSGTASPTSASAAATTAAPSTPAVTATPIAAATPFTPAFDAQINTIIAANSRYQVGVAIIDVKDGVAHEYGDKTKFVAASTAKVLAAAGYYNLVETGRASLTARMGSSTSGAQIRQMIQQSNNQSWALILGAVGQKGLTAYAASLGITYDRTLNHLSPAETAKTLSLLYSGQLLNAEHTAQLLSYMQNTNFETLIPAAVPAGITVFHKYGLLFGNLHDASILVHGDKAYAFVVYTLGKDGSDAAARTRVIHELTQATAAGLF